MSTQSFDSTTDSTTDPSTDPTSEVKPRSGLAVGLTVFASVILAVVGVFQGLLGLSAIFNDEILLATPNYLFSIDLSAWGWLHLGLGALLGFAAWALWSGAVWARTVGVIAAGLNAVANFAWLPHTPVWSTLIIALDVLVIWALTAHGRDLAND